MFWCHHKWESSSLVKDTARQASGKRSPDIVLVLFNLDNHRNKLKVFACACEAMRSKKALQEHFIASWMSPGSPVFPVSSHDQGRVIGFHPIGLHDLA
mmetsp:Transcript_21874/g.60812  ORF Transcript_21874/g.60812 Transcript_21874/m.60812 type:complete len:98 (-) Transcript_21874:2579-2872(-)